MSRVTTLPAPITDRESIRTPGKISAPPPTQTPDPISIGFLYSCFAPQLGIQRMHWC
jgi:hypothetical protein